MESIQSDIDHKAMHPRVIEEKKQTEGGEMQGPRRDGGANEQSKIA